MKIQLVLKWFHKDPFPHDFNFALESFRDSLLYGTSDTWLLSRLLDFLGVSVDSVRLQTFLNSWLYSIQIT
jgi:hypothetical protein